MKAAKSIPAVAVAGQNAFGTTSILNSFLLFIVGLSLAGSGFASLRADLLGLRVHTYLMVVGAFFPLLAITRLHLIPSRILMEMTAFAALYFATTFSGGVSASEGIKMFAAMATIITMAMLVRNWDDFVVGVLGICVGIGILAVLSLIGREMDATGSVSQGSLQEANRNTYSLYALPPILLGGFVLVSGRPAPLLSKIMIAGCVLVASLSICLGVNRSGWLGLGLIVVMIICEKSIKAAVVAALLGIFVYVLMTTVFSSSMGFLETRVHDTRVGLESDKLRWELITSSLEIALENPALGVSPQELPFVLADKMGFKDAFVAPHNVYAHIAAGSGFIALFIMLHLGWTFWRWNPRANLPPHWSIRYKESRRLMRWFLVLWLARGFFTHEIIYSPAFCMGIGLVLGLQLCFANPPLTAAERSRRTPVRRPAGEDVY